jgi:addiction module RelB/DinJ family antitoxin
MPVQDVRVTIRVNRQLKKNADALFNYLGLNMSNAVNMFLRKAVDQKGIPFPIKVDSQWAGGINTDDITSLFNDAVKKDIARKRKKGLPVARYDKKTRRS